MKNIKKFLLLSFLLTTLTGCSRNKDISGLEYGDEDAPVKIVVYSSFECDDCVNAHNKFYKTINKYIKSGDVKFVEKQVDIKRFEYDDVIYKHLNSNQKSDFSQLSEIYKKYDKWSILENKEDIISYLNLSKNENKESQKELENIRKEVDKMELEGVPYILMNGEQISYKISAEELENKIEEELNK